MSFLDIPKLQAKSDCRVTKSEHVEKFHDRENVYIVKRFMLGYPARSSQLAKILLFLRKIFY